MTLIEWFISQTGGQRVFLFFMGLLALILLIITAIAVVTVLTITFYNAKYTVLRSFGVLQQNKKEEKNEQRQRC